MCQALSDGTVDKTATVLLLPKSLHSSLQSSEERLINNVTSDLSKCCDWVAGKWPSKELKSQWEGASIAERWQKNIPNRGNSKYNLKQDRTWLSGRERCQCSHSILSKRRGEWCVKMGQVERNTWGKILNFITKCKRKLLKDLSRQLHGFIYILKRWTLATGRTRDWR